MISSVTSSLLALVPQPRWVPGSPSDKVSRRVRFSFFLSAARRPVSECRSHTAWASRHLIRVCYILCCPRERGDAKRSKLAQLPARSEREQLAKHTFVPFREASTRHDDGPRGAWARVALSPLRCKRYDGRMHTGLPFRLLVVRAWRPCACEVWMGRATARRKLIDKSRVPPADDRAQTDLPAAAGTDRTWQGTEVGASARAERGHQAQIALRVRTSHTPHPEARLPRRGDCLRVLLSPSFFHGVFPSACWQREALKKIWGHAGAPHKQRTA